MQPPLSSTQVWARNQQIAFEASGIAANFRLVITSLQVDVGGESVDTEKGYLVDTTGVCCSPFVLWQNTRCLQPLSVLVTKLGLP
jgi:hypothetical protein